MALFRLVHASDFHIARTPYQGGRQFWRQTGHDPNVLKAFARWLFANYLDSLNRPQFNAVILTGDIATTGNRLDLSAAHAFVDDPAVPGSCFTSTGLPTLDFCKPLLELLPGNHDRYKSWRRLWHPGSRVFDTIFCPNNYWSTGQRVVPCRPIPAAGTIVLSVIKADFSLRSGDLGKSYYGIPGWLGQGRVRSNVLKKLVHATDARSRLLLQQGLTPITMWAIHFDPFSTDGLLRLLKSDLLVAAAKQAGVTSILCGHTHESKIKALSDTTAVFACGTTAAADSSQNDFQVIEIDGPTNLRPTAAFRVTWYRYYTTDPNNPALGGHFPQSYDCQSVTDNLARL